jgi:vacuolar protein sorting-associated protein 52
MFTSVTPNGLRFFTQPYQGYIKSTVDGPVSVINLLAMIRINDAALRESEVRQCGPMETFCLGVRMVLWPVFQKGMDSQVTALKKFADSASGGILSKGHVKDTNVQSVRPLGIMVAHLIPGQVSQRYSAMFQCMVALSDEEEGMLFSK